MPAQPNVLLIHLDQLRWDCLSLYGNRQIQTPHMEALAEDSTVFDHHFCSYPVCTPSRYSLLSGLDVQEHGGWDNHCTLKNSILTWPKVLREKGYRTAAVGKMHFTPTYLDVGFDEMVLCEQDGPGRWEDDYHKELMARGTIDYRDIMDQRPEYRESADDAYWDSFGAGENNLDAQTASSGWIARKTVERLEQWKNHSECLMVGFVKPHHPFDPPAPWSSLYRPEELALLDGWTEECLERDLQWDKGYFDHTRLDTASLKKVQAAYYGCISEIDCYIGDFVALLKKRGIYDNTVIILTSDHGDYMGYHHLLLKSNHMYEPLMRIPLVIKSAGQRAPLRNKHRHSNTAVASRILSECSVSHKGFTDSLDREREFVFAHSHQGETALVRSERYKLLYNNINKTCCFFDLVNDPWEIRDLSDSPDVKAVIGDHLDALHAWQIGDFGERQVPFLNEKEKSLRDQCAMSSQERQLRIAYYREKFDQVRKQRKSRKSRRSGELDTQG